MRAAFVAVLIFCTNFYQLPTLAGNSVEKMYAENLQRCKAFACGIAQPRVFRYQDIINMKEISSTCEDVRPHVTILHRCDNTTGYCSSLPEKFCDAVKFEEVTIGFMVTLKHSSGGCRSRPKHIRYMQATAINHTMCGCNGKNTIN